jgi:hypothetical protein
MDTPTLVASLTAFALAVAPSTVRAQQGASLEADLAVMSQWLEGEFDNNQQVSDEKEARSPHPHERLHSIVARVSLPAIGSHVFYVQQSRDNDPAKIFLQRLYRLSVNREKQAIELVSLAFADERAVVDAHLHPERGAHLTAGTMRPAPGCELTLRREGEAFVGSTTPGACRVVSPTGGAPVVRTDEIRLTADEIWMGTRAHDAAGTLVWGHPDGVPHKLQKARVFDCWTVLRKDGTDDQYDVARGIRVHDQGHTVPVKGPGEAPSRFSFDLARLRSAESRIAVLRLAVLEQGKAQSLAYAWAEREAGRIGINLRWLQVGCRLQDDSRPVP